MVAKKGNLIKDQAGLRDWWAQYFSNLLNLPSTIDFVALNQILQQLIMNASPTLDEIKKAISQLNTNRSSGKDGIPAEIYKAASPNTLESFYHVLDSIWDKEMSNNFRDALIIASYMNKGNKADCGNYRGIPLLSNAGKIFTCVILNTLMSEKCLSEAHVVSDQDTVVQT